VKTTYKRPKIVLRHASFVPLAPLALDLPRYVPRFLLYVSAIAWLNVPLGSLLLGQVNSSIEVVKTIISLCTVSVINIGVLNPRYRADLRTRVGVNLIYFEDFLLFSSWSPRRGWWSMDAALCLWSGFLMILFGAAAILYFLAWKRQHQWVSSVTLGGNAIEPMVLTVSLTGPVYQSVVDEATEGAIRLV
jgi:hypothetical protein